MSATVYFAPSRNNNERLLDIKMKKFVILLLAFSLLLLTGCGVISGIGKGGASAICEIANGSKPTKITTDVSYVTNNGDSLTGYYVTTTDGSNAIFEYYYERLATPAESIANGNTDRIVKVEGVISFKDGSYYYGDNEAWKPGTGTALELKFHIDESLLKDVVIDESKTSLEAKVSPEDLAKIIGTDLDAIADATLSVQTNGVNLTLITVVAKTKEGTVSIRTSYTYNPQELFPEAEGGEEK